MSNDLTSVAGDNFKIFTAAAFLIVIALGVLRFLLMPQSIAAVIKALTYFGYNRKALVARTEFETWAKLQAYFGYEEGDITLLDRDGEGYKDAMVHAAWMGWTANRTQHLPLNQQKPLRG